MFAGSTVSPLRGFAATALLLLAGARALRGGQILGREQDGPGAGLTRWSAPACCGGARRYDRSAARNEAILALSLGRIQRFIRLA